MKTAYLMVEGTCFAENICPRGCNDISPMCLSNGSETGLCEFFGFSKARSAVAVTDKNGVVVNGNTFFDNRLPPEKYELEESRWIEKTSRFIEGA